MSAMASQITGVSIVCWTVCSAADQSKHQSSASLAFVMEFTGDRWIHTCAERRRAEAGGNWLQHKSLHAFTHARSRSGGGAGAKSAPQQMGPTPILPRPLRNRAFQTIFVLKKWQIRPRPHRVCVNIPAAAERGCQNPPVSAPQPLRACVNAALQRANAENVSIWWRHHV